jgi:hypothetical protein
MNFIKKHYEKILLGVVLLGLAVAVALLPVKISREAEELKALTQSLITTKPKPLPARDAARFDAGYQRLEKPVPYNFSQQHNLFNPVPWQKTADGKLIKVALGNEVGPEALGVLKMNPLFTTVGFESVGASGSNYLVSVTRDADFNPRKRGKKSFYVEVGSKGEFLTLTEVKGAADKPELEMVLNDTGEKISVTADHAFQRVDGYGADLKYDPEKRVWQGRRVGDKLMFAGDEFTVVAIQQNPVATNRFEVVVSAKSTGKKTTKEFNADEAP